VPVLSLCNETGTAGRPALADQLFLQALAADLSSGACTSIEVSAADLEQLRDLLGTRGVTVAGEGGPEGAVLQRLADRPARATTVVVRARRSGPRKLTRLRRAP